MVRLKTDNLEFLDCFLIEQLEQIDACGAFGKVGIGRVLDSLHVQDLLAARTENQKAEGLAFGKSLQLNLQLPMCGVGIDIERHFGKRVGEDGRRAVVLCGIAESGACCRQHDGTAYAVACLVVGELHHVVGES